MWKSKKYALVLLYALSIAIASKGADNSDSEGTGAAARLKLEKPATTLWDGSIGEGFRSSAQSLSIEAGAAQGFAILGTRQAHDLALLSLSYGHMLGNTVGRGHFYQGNWELRGELFAGAEFSPSREWVAGLAPHLRYNFATGTRFVPFVDAGAGVTATSIGPPDLSNIFEFNLQACVGTHYFFKENAALTVEARYIHMSCAGISSPNLGLNSVLGLLGLTFWF